MRVTQGGGVRPPCVMSLHGPHRQQVKSIMLEPMVSGPLPPILTWSWCRVTLREELMGRISSSSRFPPRIDPGPVSDRETPGEHGCHTSQVPGALVLRPHLMLIPEKPGSLCGQEGSPGALSCPRAWPSTPHRGASPGEHPCTAHPHASECPTPDPAVT